MWSERPTLVPTYYLLLSAYSKSFAVRVSMRHQRVLMEVAPHCETRGSHATLGGGCGGTDQLKTDTARVKQFFFFSLFFWVRKTGVRLLY